MRYLLIFALLLIGYGCNTSKLLQTPPAEAQQFTHEGHTLPYRIFVPDNYNGKKKYPLVVFLHGAGERGSDNEKQLTHGTARFLSAESKRDFPCILIAPQCTKEGYWASAKFDRGSYPIDFDHDYATPITKDLATVTALIEHTVNTQAVDTDRIYLTGLSMGGMGTFELIGRRPELFAAAVPICGGGDTDAYGAEQAKIPFWIFHGDADSVVPVEDSRAMHNKLKTLGANVKYTEYPGVNHNSWERAYAEPELLPWLFAQSK